MKRRRCSVNYKTTLSTQTLSDHTHYTLFITLHYTLHSSYIRTSTEETTLCWQCLSDRSRSSAPSALRPWSPLYQADMSKYFKTHNFYIVHSSLYSTSPDSQSSFVFWKNNLVESHDVISKFYFKKYVFVTVSDLRSWGIFWGVGVYFEEARYILRRRGIWTVVEDVTPLIVHFVTTANTPH